MRKWNLALSACCLMCGMGLADVSGIIVDDSGKPVADTRVFVEPGIEKEVIEGTVSLDGTFRVPGDFYGNTGVFAIAPNCGFNGIHLNIAAGEDPAGIRIVLVPAASIHGMVTDEKGTGISGVRLASIAVTAPAKVGIPLSKLSLYGISTPQTDGSGAFSIGFAPQDATIALKFEHPMYAQEAVMDVRVGTADVRTTMYRGVTVRGQVMIRNTDSPVSGSIVTARNAQPPHDTAFATSDRSGVFTVRLKPGVYLFQAFAAGRISPGLQRVDVTGQQPEQNIRLILSPTSTITGTIQDAKTSAPISGVRVLVETQGQPAGAARTGADGRFMLNAAEGDNLLIFDSVPGYLAPDTKALRVNAPGGGTLELPGLWLAPIPQFDLRVFESDGETPVKHAFISLLHPKQFGWQQTDANGQATLRFTNLPEDNRVIGIVEHPGKAQGALFALDRSNAANGSVVLLPLAEASGSVVNEQGEPVAGATVGGLFADDALPEALPLWRCITGRNGVFNWPAVVPGTPQRCIASFGSINVAAVKDINPAPEEKVDVGAITLSQAVSVGQEKDAQWQELTLLCGSKPANANGVILLCCTPAEAAVYVQTAVTMKEYLADFGVEVAVAVSGSYICKDTAVPVYKGTGISQETRIYDSRDALVLRTLGLPPINMLRNLAGG